MSSSRSGGELTVEQQTIDVEKIRRDFPILDQRVHEKPLVYLDNAATTQKPDCVIEAVDGYYRKINSNIHRGVHTLSGRATEQYEAARGTVRRFLNAKEDAEIIFLRGTTEAINLVASSYGQRLGEGDEILISHMEHHSNIVPWQILCEKTGANLVVTPITDAGELDMEQFDRRLTDRTKIVSIVHQSNSLGTVNPVQSIIEKSHAVGAVVLIDGAQATAHQTVDVQALDCDFYATSGHKLYGPTGIGVLYGRRDLLEEMPPYQSGGDMILSVTFEKTEFNHLPHKFEAGTPHIAGPIGLKAAIDYVTEIGLERIAAHENDLLEYGTALLSDIKGLTLIGTAPEKSSVLSFVLDGIHAHDVGTILDLEGVAIRTGHHCTQPVMDRYGVPATARASFGVYNTKGEVDSLAAAVKKAIEVFN